MPRRRTGTRQRDPKKTALTDDSNVKIRVVEEEKTYDVATAYALFGSGTLPSAIRGDELEDS